jgi:hypothetical protein
LSSVALLAGRFILASSIRFFACFIRAIRQVWQIKPMVKPQIAMGLVPVGNASAADRQAHSAMKREFLKRQRGIRSTPMAIRRPVRISYDAI